MTDTIEKPVGGAWFIAKSDDLSTIHHGFVSETQCMTTGLTVVDTYSTEEAYAAALAELGVSFEEQPE